MAKTLSDVMARLPAERSRGIETRAQVRIEEELALRDLRKAMGRTQVEVARKLRISQVTLSDTERRADVMLSTLRKYVGALGGELDLIARFPDREPVRIAQLQDLVPTRTRPKAGKATAKREAPRGGLARKAKAS